MIFEMASGAALTIWLYLLLGRGGFWRMRDSAITTSPPFPALSVPVPAVTAVIPARNEADVIGRSVASLAAQQYPGAFQIVVADDESIDGTVAAARSAAGSERLTVVEAASLPSGWTGKLWAIHQGVQEAQRHAPDYLLLTDADIVHSPANLATLVRHAVNGGYDLVSIMATLRCQTVAERALIPAFVFFFFMLYPPSWIRSPRHRTAGAAGGCILIRRETLELIGGIERIRRELIDDCALARAVKQAGGQVWLGLSSTVRSIREYDTFGAIGRMISRTAFTQLRHSWLLLAGTVAGLAVMYGVPPVAALAGSRLGAAAWLLMAVVYLPVLRFYRRSPLWALLLPLAAVFYAGATVHSALAYRQGAGGLWKGRVQDISKDR